MAYEILKNIVEAEKQAETIKSQAALEADNIRSDCLKKIDAMYAQVKVQAAEEETKMVKSAVDKTKDKVKDIINQSTEVCKKIEQESKSKSTAAVNAVIGKVVGKNGNS